MLLVVLGVLAAFAWVRVTFTVEVDPPVVASGGIGQDTVTLPSGPWVVRCPGPLGAGTPSWYLDQDGNTVFLPIWDVVDPFVGPQAACAAGEGGRWAGAAAIIALAVGVAVALGAAQRVDVRRRELERNPLA